MLNNLIRDYNLEQDADSERLAAVAKLLEQPYFAKISLEVRAGAPAKDIYIGIVGMTDDELPALGRRLAQPRGRGVLQPGKRHDVLRGQRPRHRSATCKLRRQFDIERDQLQGLCSTTTVAIEDELLLAVAFAQDRSSRHVRPSRRPSRRSRTRVIRHEDVPALLVSGHRRLRQDIRVAAAHRLPVLPAPRDARAPTDVFLVTPNPVFQRYIENVLPELGERNPDIDHVRDPS